MLFLCYLRAIGLGCRRHCAANNEFSEMCGLIKPGGRVKLIRFTGSKCPQTLFATRLIHRIVTSVVVMSDEFNSDYMTIFSNPHLRFYFSGVDFQNVNQNFAIHTLK